MGLSQAEKIRRELKKEFTHWGMITELLHLATHGEQSKIIDFIINKYHDLIVETLIKEGRFTIHRVLHLEVEETTSKSYSENFGKPHPLRVKATPSSTLQSLVKLNHDGYPVDRDNWKTASKHLTEVRKDLAAKRRQRASELYNPILDEGEES